MLDNNLGDALLRLDLSPRTEAPTAQVERIIDTDRRRVRRWTRIAVALWILAALGALVIFVMGGLAFPAIAKTIMEENQSRAAASPGKAGGDADAHTARAMNSPGDTLDNPQTSFTMLAKLMAMYMVLGSSSFLVLVLAGLATVLLLHRSRIATFRQINANLLQISEQLKHQPPGEAASSG
jgi:hypothetical protein